jgi:hypothetical protein
LRWATYLGGSGDDYGSGIATDGQGNIYVTGASTSTNFPVTAGAPQAHNEGDSAAYVASYSPQGQLRWATYLGGGSYASGAGIAADGQGNVYVTGDTDSADFPFTVNDPQILEHHDPHVSGISIDDDVFIASYSSLGHVRWVTDFGGPGDDAGKGIAVNSQGMVYVTGTTNGSSGYIVTDTAVQPYSGGGVDAFVAAYTSGGALRWSTYLGGTGDDEGSSIATDGQGQAYVTGSTTSTNFPVTANALQADPGGHSDAFLVVYSPQGKVRWATYLAGAGDDAGAGVAADGQGGVYLAGDTASKDFPVTAGSAQPRFSGTYDGFLARLVVPASPPAALGPARPPAAGSPHIRYFPQTRHSLGDPFLHAWDALGGIPALGLPLSEPFTLAGQNVQILERGILIRTGGNVALAPLGALLSVAHTPPPLPPFASSATRRYFSQTGHSLSGRFLAYWQTHNGSTLLGPPIAEPDQEMNGDGSGRAYLVQWFVNGRLEYHPEVSIPAYQVQPGRVGHEFLYRTALQY